MIKPINKLLNVTEYNNPDIMYQLFKSYCMPLYGCSLWDYGSKGIEKFYVTWRKAIRYIFNVPRTTHCDLLPYLCCDRPIEEHLYSRFFRFYVSLCQSPNAVTRLCSSLAFNGSNSSCSNNVTVICKYLSIPRYQLYSVKHVNISQSIPNLLCTASVIRDLLVSRYSSSFVPSNIPFLNSDEIAFMIRDLCTG